MNDTPTRYWPTNGPNYKAQDGQFVLYTDYAALHAELSDIHAKDRVRTIEHNLLTQENRALLAENKRMREALDKIARYDDESSAAFAIAKGGAQ